MLRRGPRYLLLRVRSQVQVPLRADNLLEVLVIFNVCRNVVVVVNELESSDWAISLSTVIVAVMLFELGQEFIQHLILGLDPI